MAKDRRKRRTEKEIHEAILKFLEDMDFPRTTEDIANNVGLNWYAATTHLTKLKAEGKIFHKKVGKQNQWLLKEKYEHGFMPGDEVRGKIERLESENIKLKNQVKELEEELTKIKQL